MKQAAPEQVVLLSATGEACGTMLKSEVHHIDTPLHLAFSCYLFDDRGRLLTTQRALSKPTWPGAWTNSVCGHPGPGEPMVAAVKRRVRAEVGLEAIGVRLLLPAFRYRAVMDNGMVENEMCPVYVAVAQGHPAPDPSEVAATAWVDWVEFRASVLRGARPISPWCREQIEQLPADPLTAEEQPASLLPPAAGV